MMPTCADKTLSVKGQNTYSKKIENRQNLRMHIFKMIEYGEKNIV